jgi:hypothetical protein
MNKYLKFILGFTVVSFMYNIATIGQDQTIRKGGGSGGTNTIDYSSVTNALGYAPVNKAGDTMSALETTKAFRQYQGTLTHAGTVTLDFDGATTLNSLMLTGNVTFAFSNLATNRTYSLRIVNTQATNCLITWPAGSLTNFVNGIITNSPAHSRIRYTGQAWGATDADVDNVCAVTQ